MYKRIKQCDKTFKINIIIIIPIVAMVIINKIMVRSDILNNILCVILFILMMALPVQIALMNKSQKKDIMDMAKMMDDILASKYNAEFRCEPQTKTFTLNDNVLLHNNSVSYNYRIYGEINNCHVEFLHNFHVYHITYHDEKKSIYPRLIGHAIAYWDSIDSNCDIAIQSPLYKNLYEADYRKADYERKCEFDDGSLVYIRQNSKEPDMKKLKSEYTKIVSTINMHLKSTGFIVFIKNDATWVYVQTTPNKGDVLTSAPDTGKLKPEGLDDIINTLRQITSERT